MKNVFETILLLVALTISASAPVAHAQPPVSGGIDKYVKFDHLTTENGLSNDSVWGMAQDSDGFMWFGTFDGLNRYDGSDIKVFRRSPRLKRRCHQRDACRSDRHTLDRHLGKRT